MTDTNLKLRTSDTIPSNENKGANIGSKKCPFKLAIIGAGPAGYCLIASITPLSSLFLLQLLFISYLEFISKFIDNFIFH